MTKREISKKDHPIQRIDYDTIEDYREAKSTYNDEHGIAPIIEDYDNSNNWHTDYSIWSSIWRGYDPMV